MFVLQPVLTDIEVDQSWSKEDFLEKGFYIVNVGIAPIRTQKNSNILQAKRKQYALRHRVTATIHAVMGDTLKKVTIQIAGGNYELWDKAQIIVGMSRTKLGKDVIFVGDKQSTINKFIALCQRRNQWTDYMESILNMVTLKVTSNTESQKNSQRIPTLTTQYYPFRICDIPLPQCKSGFVYFLMSPRTQSYTYIGEYQCIIHRLAKHNSGHGSLSTIPSNQRPYAIFGYIAGFNGADRVFRRVIEKMWKEKRDFLIESGNEDPIEWFRSAKDVIFRLDDRLYAQQISELRFKCNTGMHCMYLQQRYINTYSI